MESSLEIEARTVLVNRLNGARRDVAGVARYLDCCPLPLDAPVLPVLLAACDCLDEAIARLGGAGAVEGVEASAAFDEPVDDG